MKITWEAQDGYVGGAAPQSFKIPDDEILEYASVDEVMQMIEEWIQSDFEQKVSWTAPLDEIRKEVESLFKSKGEE